jgi:hypothetical protein
MVYPNRLSPHHLAVSSPLPAFHDVYACPQHLLNHIRDVYLGVHDFTEFVPVVSL